MMNEGNNSSSMNFVHSNIEIELLPSWGYAVCACLLLIIFLIGFTSNTVVMILFIKCPKVSFKFSTFFCCLILIQKILILIKTDLKVSKKKIKENINVKKITRKLTSIYCQKFYIL